MVTFGMLLFQFTFWKYRGGFKSVMKAKQYIRENKEFLEFARKRRTMLEHQGNAALHSRVHFALVNQSHGPQAHIYELITYHLKGKSLLAMIQEKVL
ncbi:Nipsnap, partial [Desmophyllum pertusum]